MDNINEDRRLQNDSVHERIQLIRTQLFTSRMELSGCNFFTLKKRIITDVRINRTFQHFPASIHYLKTYTRCAAIIVESILGHHASNYVYCNFGPISVIGYPLGGNDSAFFG